MMIAAFSSMVTWSDGHLHNHVSVNRVPSFVKCRGTRDVAMHGWGGGGFTHWCRRASCGKCSETVMVNMHGVETRLLMISTFNGIFIKI